MIFPDNIHTEHFDFVNYTLLSEEDSRAIWQARNHPEVSRWMENSEPIPWEEHLQYVKSLAMRDDRVYYAVFTKSAGGGKLIGSQCVNPIEKDGTGESGLYLLPEQQGKGLGKLMKKEFIDYIFNHNLLQQITEKVKHDNIRNQQLNLSLGFQRTGEDERYVYFSLTKDKFRQR